MRKLILLSLVVVFGFLSCEEDDDNDKDDCYPETVLSIWEAEKEISIELIGEPETNYYSVVDGDKLVFTYNHVGAQCDHIMDDEWGEKLIFQIDDNLTAFQYTDEEILVTNCFYQQYGAWVDGHQYPVNTGTIKGEKTAENEWEVIVNIEINTAHEEPLIIEFTQIFKK